MWLKGSIVKPGRSPEGEGVNKMKVKAGPKMKAVEVFTSTGHILEIDGIRGKWAFYDAPAFSKDGKFMALSAYYDEVGFYKVEKLPESRLESLDETGKG